MFRHVRRSLFIVLVSALLMSCAGKSFYKYDGVSYEEPEPALAAQKTDIEAVVSKIIPTNNPLGGSAVVILPSFTYVVKNFVVWKGPEPNQDAKAKMENFMATSIINVWQASCDLIKKRQIFESVAIAVSDDPENAAYTEAIALILFKKDGKAQWFLRKKKGNSELIAIEEISTALPPVQRSILWLDSIEQLLRKE